MRGSVLIAAALAVFISCIYCNPVQDQGDIKGDRPSVNKAPLQGQKQGQGLVNLQHSEKNESILEGRPNKPNKRPGSNLGSSSSAGDRKQNVEAIVCGKEPKLPQRQERT